MPNSASSASETFLPHNVFCEYLKIMNVALLVKSGSAAFVSKYLWVSVV